MYSTHFAKNLHHVFESIRRYCVQMNLHVPHIVRDVTCTMAFVNAETSSKMPFHAVEKRLEVLGA